MTLYTLAVRNIRHELRRYGAFFLSAAFSVWIFYMYASLLAHPQMTEENLGSMLLGPLQAVTGVIAIFAVLFIAYAQSSFQKLRQKELGIYTLMGMLPGQMLRVVFYENLAVGLGATTTGAAFGAVYLKLFLLGVGKVLRLDTPLPFHFSWKATLLTYGLFLAVFTILCAASYVRIRRLPVAELIRAAAKPKAPPTLAWWKVTLCLGSIGGAYGLLLTATTANLEQRFLVMLGLLLVGTALLFSQGSVALLGALQRQRGLYLRRTNLFVLSQLVYKMRDNALVLFMVSLLVTGVLVAGGVYYGAHAAAADWAEKQAAVHVVLADRDGVMTADRVVRVLRERGTPPVAWAELPVIADLTLLMGPQGSNRAYGLTVTPAGAFNRWVRSLAVGEPVAVAEGQGVLLHTGRIATAGDQAQIALAPYNPGLPPSSAPGPVVGAEVTLVPAPAGVQSNRVLGANRYSWMVLVVGDGTFAALQERFGAQQGVTISGYNVANWRALGPAIRQLTAEITASGRHERTMKESPWVRPLTGTWSWYDGQRQETALFLFLFGFVSLLFFLAAGNMLYFKLLNDLQDDRRQFQALHKLGSGTQDVRRIIGTQTLVVFFAPFAVAVVHAAVLLHVLGRLLAVPTSLWGAVGTVAGIYLALHGTYFLAARRTYTQAVIGQL